jgi:hypothetical protein
MNEDDLRRFEKTAKKLTKMPRPGPDIKEPGQQHMVLAMMILMCLADNREATVLKDELEAAVRTMWDWDEERFHAELIACRDAMVDSRTRFTCWFTEYSIEFDMNVPQ